MKILKLKLLLVICALTCNAVFAQENSANGDSHVTRVPSLELPKIKVIPIKDIKTDGQYELYVKLPEGYSENNDTKYPVLYYTDAMWHVEILSAATEYMLENVILVGISWQKDISEDLKKEYGVHFSRFSDYSSKENL